MAKKKDLKRSMDQAQASGQHHKRSKKILGLDLGSIGKVVATAVIAEIANTALRKSTQSDQDADSPVTEAGLGQAGSGDQSGDQTNSARQAPHQPVGEPPLKSAVPDPAASEAEQPRTTAEPQADQPGWVNPLLNGVQPMITEVAPLLGQTVAQSIAALGQRVIRPEPVGEAVGEAAAQTATQTGAAVSQAGELSEQAIETISTAVQKALEQALTGVGSAKQAVVDRLGEQTAENLPSKKQTKKAKRKKQAKKAKHKNKK